MIDVISTGISKPVETVLNSNTGIDTHIINIRTVLRSIIRMENTVSSQTRLFKQTDKLAETLYSEVITIKELYADKNINVLFWLPEYNSLRKQYGEEKFRVQKNPIYNVFSSENINFWNVFSKKYNVHFEELNISSYGYTKAYMTSHMSVDFLNIKYFEELVLVESHTGLIKDTHSLWTKYNKVGDIDWNLPFTEELLFIIGDKNFVKPTKHKIRKHLQQLSIEHNCTPYSTMDKVGNCLTSIYREFDVKKHKKYFQ
jgi:hypothetical protein